MSGRNYVRLPFDDDEFLEALEAHGGNKLAYAAEIGCSESAVYARCRLIAARRAAGLPQRQPPAPRPKGGLTTRLEAVEAALIRVEAAIAESGATLAELLAKPVTVIEWRPNTRRISDGGTSIRRQRRQLRSGPLPALPAPADWRQNRPDREGKTR